MISARLREVLELPSGRVLPIAHPTLRVFAQNVSGHPAIVVDHPGDIEAFIDGSRGIRVVKERRAQDQTYLRFESESEGPSALFSTLVETLLESSAAAGKDSALSSLLAAFDDFKSMLASRRGRLGESAVRGLYAELALLEELLDSGVGEHDVMLAWHGPFGGAKDFVLAEGESIEVKSARRLLHRVQISSVDQLESRGDILTLAVLVLDQRVDGGGDALLDRIAAVRARLSNDVSAKRLFEDALEALSFDEADDYYASWRFDVGEWVAFSVSDDFPRIRLADVPLGVLDVRFRLDTDQLADYVVPAPWRKEP